jgi:hypothetical protein
MTTARLSEKVESGFVRRVTAESVVAAIGIGLIAGAFLANLAWFDRHFLPPFFATRSEYIAATWAARIAGAVLGATLLLVFRPRIGRWIASRPLRTFLAGATRIALAVVLALGVSELALRRTVFGLASEERPREEEPLRHRDPHLGWLFVPSRTGHDKIGGRSIEYTFDAAGYRVRGTSDPVNPDRPTIVFTGESTMVGHGLTWDESIPGQVQALAGIQSANIAVEGYATDQAYLRLVAELPHFRQPVAVVSLFAPNLFDRDLDNDRPHLDPGLVWRTGKRRWSLLALAAWLAPYRSQAEIDRGIAATRQVLRASVDLARSRGAVSIIVVPVFAPEQTAERTLRQRILDEAALPCIVVQLDPSWRIPWDRHPNARGARAVAEAIVARLPRRL